MSCMITSPEIILTIAETIARISSNGREDYGVDIPRGLAEELRKLNCYDNIIGAPYVVEKRLAEELYRLNIASYNGRYKEHQQPNELPDFDETKPAFKVPRCEYDGRYIYTEDHFKFAGALAFLIYQCDEDANRENALLVALAELATAWNSAIVRADPRYCYGGIIG